MACEANTEKHSLLFKIERQVFAHQEDFDENFHKTEPPVKQNSKLQVVSCSITKFVKLCLSLVKNISILGDKGSSNLVNKITSCSSCSATQLKEFLYGLFPILNWLPKYSWKDQLFGDVMSGCTVAIMHIPQGLPHAYFTPPKSDNTV